jgi:hypothetical protein
MAGMHISRSVRIERDRREGSRFVHSIGIVAAGTSSVSADHQLRAGPSRDYEPGSLIPRRLSAQVWQVVLLQHVVDDRFVDVVTAMAKFLVDSEPSPTWVGTGDIENDTDGLIVLGTDIRERFVIRVYAPGRYGGVVIMDHMSLPDADGPCFDGRCVLCCRPMTECDR